MSFPMWKKLLPQDGCIELCRLKTKYPQGAEKQLIFALTGREVPSGKLPADAGLRRVQRGHRRRPSPGSSARA